MSQIDESAEYIVSSLTSCPSGTIITHHGLGVNASGTDASIFSSDSVDWMYVNAAAYGSVHAFAITGRGDFSLYQRFSLEDMLGMQTDATKTLAVSDTSSGKTLHRILIPCRVKRFITSRLECDRYDAGSGEI